MPRSGQTTVGGIPYGGAYIVDTPILDRIGREFHAEQVQKEKQYQENSKMLDSEFSKNAANIRDADVNDLTNKYGEFKNYWKQLNQPNRKVSPQEELELLRKKSEIIKLANASKAERKNEEVAALDVHKNPGNFEDNASQFLVERRRLPMSHFQIDVPKNKFTGDMKLDVSNIYDNILYKGNNTDFSGLHKKAEGSFQQRGKPITSVSKDGLTSTDTSYKANNSPAEYADVLRSGIKGSIAERDFLMQHQYTDQEENDIVSKYSALSQTPEFKAAWGNGDIPQSLFLSKKGRAIALASMEHAINHPPTVTVGKPYQNIGAVMNLKNQEYRNRLKLQEGKSKRIISFMQGGNANGEVKINDVYDKLSKNQDNPESAIHINYKGQKYTGARFNSLDSETQGIVMKAVKDGGYDIEADEVYTLREPDGAIAVYKTDENGKPFPSTDRRIFTLPKVGVNLKAQPSVKEKREVISQGEIKKEKYPLPKGQPKTVKQGNFTYTYNPETGEYE